VKASASLFADAPVLGFVFQRVAAEGGAELGHLSVASIFFTIVMLTLSISNLMDLSRVQNIEPASIRRWRISAVVIILGVIVLVANLLDETTEIALRYFFYMYFFMGLVFPIFAARHRKYIILVIPLLILWIPIFFYNLQFGIWSYSSMFNLMFLPSWDLWSYRL
jgi:hypothetical protein